MTDREIRKPTGKDLGFATSSSSPELSINGDVNLIVNGSPVRVELGGGRLIPSVGFLGPRGTYTEEAKEALMGVNTSGKFTEEPLRMTNRGVVEVIDQGVFDVGVVASENAIEGDVAMTWKALLKSDLSILGETVLPIHNMLIGNPDEPITEIRTHSHAFPQCERFLTQYHPDVERVETSSTAQAVEDIVNRKGAAAIASRNGAELYRVQRIDENVGTN